MLEKRKNIQYNIASSRLIIHILYLFHHQLVLLNFIKQANVEKCNQVLFRFLYQL